MFALLIVAHLPASADIKTAMEALRQAAVGIGCPLEHTRVAVTVDPSHALIEVGCAAPLGAPPTEPTAATGEETP